MFWLVETLFEEENVITWSKIHQSPSSVSFGCLSIFWVIVILISWKACVGESTRPKDVLVWIVQKYKLLRKLQDDMLSLLKSIILGGKTDNNSIVYKYQEIYSKV